MTWYGGARHEGPFAAVGLRARAVVLQVEDQGVISKHFHHARVIQFANTAARIVQEVIVAVDLFCLDDEPLDIIHGRNLGVSVQMLPSSVQAVPLDLKVHEVEQQEPAVPLVALP